MGGGGSGLVSWVSLLTHVIRVTYVGAMLMLMVYILMIICVAPPILVGAWLMAVLQG